MFCLDTSAVRLEDSDAEGVNKPLSLAGMNFAFSSWNLNLRSPRPMQGMLRRLHLTQGGCRPPEHCGAVSVHRQGRSVITVRLTFFFCCLHAAQPRLLGTPTMLSKSSQRDDVAKRAIADTDLLYLQLEYDRHTAAPNEWKKGFIILKGYACLDRRIDEQ